MTVRNWPRTLIDHLGLSTTDYVCHLRSDLRFHVRGGTDDRPIIVEVFVERIYPVEMRPGSIVVDIGAHIGCFAVAAAVAGGRVFSFEPYPANFPALQSNVTLNGARDVQLSQAAVTGKRETRRMFLPDNPGHSARYSLLPGRGSRTLDTRCISLDNVLHENGLDRVDELKLDCQGSEYEILYGASAQTLAMTRRLVCECGDYEGRPEWSVPALGPYLTRQGFSTTTRGELLNAERTA